MEPLAHESDHDLVRDERPRVHVPLGFEAQTRPSGSRLTEHVARRDVGDAPFLCEGARLRALAGTGRAQEDDAKAHACAFAFFLRKPS